MPNNPIILPRGLASADGTVASGQQVSVDSTALANVEATQTQEVANELNRLFEIVNSGQPGQPGNRFEGQFVPFTSSINIGSSNFDLYTGKIALYARSDDARVNFILPTDAEITAEGVGANDSVEYTILNQAGTARFDTGGGAQGPNNTVRIDVEGANNIRRNTATGTLLNFIEAHQNDLVTLTQSARGEPWVAVRVTLSNAALLLPSGLFRLQVGTRVSMFSSLGFITGIPAGVTPQAGDAYEVQTGNDTFGGFGVDTGDVIVALQDNPNRQISDTNDDWIVIRNATNDIITLSEIHFLNTVTETDAFEDDRLMDRSDVNDVRVFLSTGILDHAPFITPSTDPDNPQSDGTRYVGGDEDVSTGNEFHLTDFTKVGEPAGSSRFPNAFIYFDIDGSFDINELNNVFVVIKDRDGVEVDRHNAVDHFRGVTLTGSSDTYYVFDRVGASDNYSSITYLSGYTIDVVYRRTLRSFEFSDAVNALGAIADGSIPIGKLEPNVQALINADHSLTDEQETILDGFETGGTATTWTAGTLYVKDNAADPNSDAGRYYNVGQQNGILADHDHTRSVTFVVPNFVTVTQLQRTDDTSIKHPVTRLGALTIQDNTANPPTTFNGQGFTATLPASSFDINNPVGDAWQIDGTASNLELQGAQPSFKVDVDNLDQSVIDALRPAAYVPIIPTPVATAIAHDITVTTRTTTTWQTIPTPDNAADLTRQFAFGWDENRRSFGTDNYFEDLTGLNITGYAPNTIFYYNDPNDDNNTSFPGAQSYILNDNVRFRNQSGQSVISDSFRKIIGFDYALQRTLTDPDNVDMLRIGPSGTVPLIGLHNEEGLYLNIGRGDGGQRSRTITQPLTANGALEYPFGSVGGLSTLGEAPFIGPNPNVEGTTFPITIDIHFRLDNNGNDEGTITHQYTITDVDVDQAETTFDITHTDIDGQGGSRTFTWAVRYDANHNHATFGVQDIIFIRDVTAESNPALTDYVSMSYDRTVTYNVPATYARFPINAGDGHDDFGLFDPSRYNTEHIDERNRVMLLLRPFSLTDTSSDPEMGIQVIVDGQKEGSSSSGYLINLHRVASEFDFTDMSFGNSICAVSHIQCYDYDGGHLIGEDGLLDFYNAADRWLGRFRHPTETTDTFEFAGLAKFTGVIGSQDVEVTMIEDAGATDGYRWKFTEI